MGDLVPNQLFVAGYSRSKITCDRDIKEIFKKFGSIKDVAYKGTYSFVTFTSEGEAQEALKQLNNQVINGQKLKVDIVDNRKGRRSGPSETDECFKCGKGGRAIVPIDLVPLEEGDILIPAQGTKINKKTDTEGEEDQTHTLTLHTPPQGPESEDTQERDDTAEAEPLPEEIGKAEHQEDALPPYPLGRSPQSVSKEDDQTEAPLYLNEKGQIEKKEIRNQKHRQILSFCCFPYCFLITKGLFEFCTLIFPTIKFYLFYFFLYQKLCSIQFSKAYYSRKNEQWLSNIEYEFFILLLHHSSNIIQSNQMQKLFAITQLLITKFRQHRITLLNISCLIVDSLPQAFICLQQEGERFVL